MKRLGRTPGCPTDTGALALPPVAPGDDPKARRRRLVLARLLLSRGKAAEALAHLGEGGLGSRIGLARQPCDADVACLRGRCMAALGNNAEVRMQSPCLGAGWCACDRGLFWLRFSLVSAGIHMLLHQVATGAATTHGIRACNSTLAGVPRNVPR